MTVLAIAACGGGAANVVTVPVAPVAAPEASIAHDAPPKPPAIDPHEATRAKLEATLLTDDDVASADEGRAAIATRASECAKPLCASRNPIVSISRCWVEGARSIADRRFVFANAADAHACIAELRGETAPIAEGDAPRSPDEGTESGMFVMLTTQPRHAAHGGYARVGTLLATTQIDLDTASTGNWVTKLQEESRSRFLPVARALRSSPPPAAR
jgi:hypothetical protein